MSDVQEQERWDLSLISLTILSGAATGRGMGGDMSCRRRHDDDSEQAYDLAESIAGGRSMLVGGHSVSYRCLE